MYKGGLKRNKVAVPQGRVQQENGYWDTRRNSIKTVFWGKRMGSKGSRFTGHRKRFKSWVVE